MQNYGDRKNRACQVSEGEKEESISGTQEFQASETILYDTVIVDMRHSAFIKIHVTVQHKEGTLV